MSDRPYPTQIADIEKWSQRHGTTKDEARQRFMQFVILEAIATSPQLRTNLAFKGGNALRLLFLNRRTTKDLDFTAEKGFPDNKDEIRRILNAALKITMNRNEVKCRCQSIRRNPPGSEKTFPTYQIKIGYRFPGDRYFIDFEKRDKPVSSVIELELSLNDEVCETTMNSLTEASSARLKTCTLEDIIAEKLRALLQQVIRNRNRKQDLSDVVQMFRKRSSEIDVKKISDYFVRKCRVRNIYPTKEMFNDDVKARAAYEYETLFSVNDPEYIPVDQAWNELRNVIQTLDIPAS